MKKSGIIRYLQVIILSLGIAFVSAAEVYAVEITAVDFNGNVIGQVISNGLVINADGENIGYITADSLILNNDNEVIGGVIPQGVAIGMDNRPLGKVNSDGFVRSETGKSLGRALPNGLVVNEEFNVIGAILFPGLIYASDGSTVGRLTGAGTYTNLDGNEVGFVSANGYAYRKSGEEYLLDGRLMSSKMVVSLTGEFIGSISPSGRVINFEGKDIGKIHANEYVYDNQNQIVGRLVCTGYAFDLNGRYMGIITYNGTVVNGTDAVAFYRADGNIVNKDNEVIGFSVPLSATANDNTGHYLGRVAPKGLVLNNTEIAGHIGIGGFVYDQNNNKIGQITVTGPVFNTLGNLSGQAMSNGTYISLKGSTIGRIKGSLAFDGNGMLAGGLLENNIAIGSNNKILGSAEMNAFVLDGAERKKVSPFGYLMTSENKLDGRSQRLSPVYGLEGQIYSYLTPNGSLYRDVSDVRLNMNGVLTGKNGYIGNQLDIYYALGFKGLPLGRLSSTNIIFDDKGEAVYKVTPGYNVVAVNGSVGQNMMPLRGYAGSRFIAVGTNGDLLGYAGEDGKVMDLEGHTYGHVLYGNYVSDNNNSVTGKLLPFIGVGNDKCTQIGIVNGRGEVINNRDVAIGRLLPNGQAISDVGSYIGYAVFETGLIDFDGNYAGVVNAGKGVDMSNKSLGCINRAGIILDSDNKWQYGVITPNPVIDFENNIIGQVLENGAVADNNNQILGSMQPNGTVVSKSKKALGNVMRYKVAFRDDNTFLGMVQNNGQVWDAKNENVGQVNFDGSVQHNGEVIGFALYDMYVYDNNFVVYGYIMKDGVILNISGSKMGKMDRGFVVDKTGQVVARGNRDYTVRDASNNAVGELQIDGSVTDYNSQNIGYLAEIGIIRNVSGNEIAKAYPLQYYIASEKKPDSGQDWADYKKVQIQDEGKTKDKVPTEQKQTGSSFNRRIIGIALSPDGDILGSIYDDNKVYNEDGSQIGFRTPDGMIVDMKYNPIGVEEIKNSSAQNMFVPAGTFGSGNAYGIGNKPASLGPGGGYGEGERYDPAKASALNQLQAARREGMQVGSIGTDIKVSSFTGYEEEGWGGIDAGQISTWRVDMSEMILEDKPIPAVLARSVYASDGLGSNIPVTAVVERNVFAEEGRNIIIPAGSRVIGDLGSENGAMGGNSGGAVKIGIQWRRLIRPDGSQFDLGDAQTADAQGRAGAIGYLDEQLLKKYTAPMLITAMESATSYMMASGDGSTTTDYGTSSDSKSEAASQARENFLNQMNTIFEEIIEAKASIRSVTYVPAGTRIIIFPNKDLWLNSQKLSKTKDSNVSGRGRGTVDGLVTPGDYLDRERSDTRGSFTSSGEYEEDIRPTGGNQSAARNRRNAANQAQRQRPEQNNGNVPANIPQQTISPEDSDVPSLL